MKYPEFFLAQNDSPGFITDPKFSLEIARESEVIPSSKNYTTGKMACNQPYDYLLVIANPCQLFPSTTILHMIELVSEAAASPCYSVFVKPKVVSSLEEQTPKLTRSDDEILEREAKIDDLLSFVSEIAKNEKDKDECRKNLLRSLKVKQRKSQ